MSYNNIKYPILVIDKSKNIYYARNEDEITICNSRYLEDGEYKGLEIIDLEGNLYIIDNAFKIRNIGGIFGYNFFLQRKIKVKLEIKLKPIKLSLENFKNKIIDTYFFHREFWDSGGDLQDIVNFINKGNSIKEIIYKLCMHFYGEKG